MGFIIATILSSHGNDQLHKLMHEVGKRGGKTDKKHTSTSVSII